MRSIISLLIMASCALTVVQSELKAAAPEIDVYIDGTLLRGTSISKKLIATYTTGPARAVSVSIRNVGNANLTVGSWVVTSGFTTPPLSPITILPGRRFDFNVSLNLSSTGIKTGVLQFTSNDSNERNISISLRGKVLPPITSSSPTDRASSFPSYTINESRSGTNISIDVSNGPTPWNGSFVISDNRGFRWTFDNSLRTVILNAGPGVTIEDWTEGLIWPPMVIIRR